MTAIATRLKGFLPAGDHPLVNGKPVKARWLQMTVDSLIVAIALTCAVAGGYYILLQIDYHIPAHLIGTWPSRTITILNLKPWWDGLFKQSWWPVYRHDLRNQGESLLAILGVMTVVAKWKPERDKPLKAGPLVLRTLLCLALIVPLIVASVYLIDTGLPFLWHKAFGHQHVGNPVHFPHALAFLGTFLSGFPWEFLIAGVIIGRIIKTIFRPVGVTLNGFLVDRQVHKARAAALLEKTSMGKRYVTRQYAPKFPWPPTSRERYWHTMDHRIEVPAHTRSVKGVSWTALISGFISAVIGAYAKYWLGTGHTPFIH